VSGSCSIEISLPNLPPLTAFDMPYLKPSNSTTYESFREFVRRPNTNEYCPCNYLLDVLFSSITSIHTSENYVKEEKNRISTARNEQNNLCRSKNTTAG